MNSQPKLSMGKRAATYARYSTNLQDEMTIEDQQRQCRLFADKHGIEIVHEFTDLGISGVALGNRPGVNALMKAAGSGDFDVVIFADLSRLSRTNADLPRLIKRLKFQQVRVFGTYDQFDSESSTAAMQVGFSGIASDDFIALVSRKTHGALELRVERGTSAGGVAYGYTTDAAHKRVIVPEKAKIVREIFKRAAAAETLLSIASDLNKRGVPSPGAGWKRTQRRTDGRWMLNTLNALVQNEIYIGNVVWNRTRGIKDPDTGKKDWRARPPSEHKREHHPELRLVDQHTWDAVHAVMTRRKQSIGRKGGGSRKYPLSGLLVCGVCGSKLVIAGGSKNSRGFGGGKRYYQCATFHGGGIHACSNRWRADRERCEALLLGTIREQVLSPDAIAAGCRLMRQQLKEAPPAPVVDSSAIDRKVAKLKAAIESGALDAEDAEPVFAKLDADRAELRRIALKQASPLLSGPWGLEQEFRRVASELLENLGSDDASVVRAALATVCGDKIMVTPEQSNGQWVLVAHVIWQADSVLAMTGTSPGRISLSSGGRLRSHIALI